MAQSDGLSEQVTSLIAERDVRRRLILARVNSHRLDCRIVFRPEDHVYILDGLITFPCSVSQVVARFFPVFDACGVVRSFFDKWALDPCSKYHEVILQGRTTGLIDAQIQDGIVACWAATGLAASIEGTRMHRQIELFLNSNVDDRSCAAEMVQLLGMDGC